VATGDELSQGQLRLLAPREGARVLVGLVAGEAEHAEQPAQLADAPVRGLAHVFEQ
jgi:hypothetical protein